MSAVNILLNDLAQGGDASQWVADTDGTYVLTVDDEIVVNIHESAESSDVSFYTSPGYLWDADGMADIEEHWRSGADDAGGECNAARNIAIDPLSGVIVLIRTRAREQLDSVAFREELARAVDQHRYWSDLLSDVPPGPAQQGVANEA